MGVVLERQVFNGGKEDRRTIGLLIDESRGGLPLTLTANFQKQ